MKYKNWVKKLYAHENKKHFLLKLQQVTKKLIIYMYYDII